MGHHWRACKLQVSPKIEGGGQRALEWLLVGHKGTDWSFYEVNEGAARDLG